LPPAVGQLMSDLNLFCWLSTATDAPVPNAHVAMSKGTAQNVETTPQEPTFDSCRCSKPEARGLSHSLRSTSAYRPGSVSVPVRMGHVGVGDEETTLPAKPKPTRLRVPSLPQQDQLTQDVGSKVAATNFSVAARLQAKSPSLIMLHQALLQQAHAIMGDPQPSVASLKDSPWSNEQTAGIFLLRGAAPETSAVRQQLEEAKKENACLKKQMDMSTIKEGRLRQLSRNLMHQLQREVSRSQRLEQQMIDYAVPQFGANGCVSTIEVGARTCTAGMAAQEEVSVGVTNVLALSPPLVLPAVPLALAEGLSKCDEDDLQNPLVG